MSASPAFLEFRSVRKTYDQRTMVVRDFNLDVQRGEFVTLLGPSGSGKTTVLMMLAGFEGVTGGSITVDGHPITRTPSYKRNIGMVFQNYALFPHMSVAGNLAYPLRLRKLPRAQIEARVKQYLKLIELEAFGERQPGQLSGGQRQRVALARALIFEPTLVLMDEPLGALDKKLREQMQFEITRLHEELGFTVIYVTHDQTEALTMSSRIAVFNQGVVQQFAAPSALYETPANAFVASFIGENNLIPATGIALDDAWVRASLADGMTVRARNGDCRAGQDRAIISIRPEKLRLHEQSGEAQDNRIAARFVVRHYVGDFIRYYFRLADDTPLVVKQLNDARAPHFELGQQAWLRWAPGDCFAFQPDSASQQQVLQ